MKQILKYLSLTTASLAAFFVLTTPTHAATNIVVNSKADTTTNNGACTLREAIIAANNDTASGAAAGECAAGSGADTISFNITGTADFTNGGQNGYTIAPTSVLPNITEQVTINGYSQPGSLANTAVAPNPLNGRLLIELNGGGVSSGSGIRVFQGGDNSVIQGLVVNGFIDGDAIHLYNNSGVKVQGNYIGTNPSGMEARPNEVGVNGSFTSNYASDVLLGGLNPANRNIISGNTAGTTAAGSYPGPGWVIQGNYVGVAADGTTPLPNSFSGGSGAFSIDYVDNVTVGGSVIGSANVISGNYNHAIAPSSADNVVIQGNFIGTDYTGTVAIPNGGAGIGFSDSDNVQIGGPEDLARNVIANNSTFGISLHRVNGARVENNYIGTDVTGTQKMGNDFYGIDIIDSSNLTIGGASSDLRNIISNNGTQAVAGSGSNITLETSGDTPPSNNAIIGNYIGVDSSGKLNPNFINANGIMMVATATNNIVGGDEANEGNIIAGNRGGIIISTFTIPGFGSFSPSKNAIIGNRIFQNDEASALPNVSTSLGIDLMELVEEDFPPDGYESSANSGPTVNDPTDSDTGPNNYINFPVLNSVTQDGSTATINFDLDAADSPTNQYRVEFFANDQADPSGYGEGQTFLGSATVSNGDNQQTSFTLPNHINLTGKSISATTTAIDNTTNSGFGSTSEFSLVKLASVIAPPQNSPLAATGQNQILILLAAIVSITGLTLVLLRASLLGAISS